MVLLTGIFGTGLKYMAAKQWQEFPLNPLYNNCFMLGMYGALLLAMLAESAWRARTKTAWVFQLLTVSSGCRDKVMPIRRTSQSIKRVP